MSVYYAFWIEQWENSKRWAPVEIKKAGEVDQIGRAYPVLSRTKSLHPGEKNREKQKTSGFQTWTQGPPNLSDDSLLQETLIQMIALLFLEVMGNPADHPNNLS